jgi:hypothetical protein
MCAHTYAHTYETNSVDYMYSIHVCVRKMHIILQKNIWFMTVKLTGDIVRKWSLQ